MKAKTKTIEAQLLRDINLLSEALERMSDRLAALDTLTGHIRHEVENCLPTGIVWNNVSAMLQDMSALLDDTPRTSM